MISGWIRSAAALVAGAAVLTGAGCGFPAGVDGDLVSDWALMAEPETMVPQAGVCHRNGHRRQAPMSLYNPIGCDEPHLVETVHVGQFDGDIAGRASPPEAGTAHWRTAFDECDDAAAEYLGADFRHGRFWLAVAVPTDLAWSGGARWFRCDVETGWPTPHLAPRAEGTRRGVLAADSELSLGCFLNGGEDFSRFDRENVECSEPHDMEFVGVWRSTSGKYPESTFETNRVINGCLGLVAAYVGVPDDRDLIYRTGTIFDGISEEEWADGDRGFRCYLWLGDRKVTKSLAGVGDKGLPVN